jgi:hypothetical protein
LRLDISFYRIEKNNVKGKIKRSLVLKLVEITIYGEDTDIGSKKTNESFKPQHISKNSLTEARNRKEVKYAGIITRWNKLLKTDYGEEIKQAYKVDDIKV